MVQAAFNFQFQELSSLDALLSWATVVTLPCYLSAIRVFFLELFQMTVLPQLLFLIGV